MKKFVIVIFSSLILSACSFPFTKTKKSALDIKSDPVASIYINGDHVGSTPYYKDDFKPGDYTVKLVSESNPDLSWQTQITLKPQLLTNITRSFGPSEDSSSHFTLSLDQINKKDSSEIVVITTPDSAVVKKDGQPVGFAPVEMTSVNPGDHQIIIGSPGYKQLVIPIKAIAGHKLTISAKLAKDKDLSSPTPNVQQEEATSSATTAQDINKSVDDELTPKASTKATSSAQLDKPFVTIKQTETGWLRVRSEPSGLSNNEVGKVNVGESFPFIKTNNSGWYQIEYEPNKIGWISSHYATLVE